MAPSPSTPRERAHTERIRLRVWHPNCWTLRVTAGSEAGLIAYGVYEVEEAVKARVVAYGDAEGAIDELAAAIRRSPLTDRVHEVRHSFGEFGTDVPGNASRELLVGYRRDDSIHDAFVSRGLIPDAPIRIRDGVERWTVLVDESTDPEAAIDAVVDEMGAEVEVTGTGAPIALANGPDDRLTERQREVFETARRRGYYAWPRETSAEELAGEVGVAKATLLEHLRKAEAKLLGR